MMADKNWEETRKAGRLVFSLKKALLVAAIISLAAYLFVYLTNYELSTSKEEFALVLFLVMFLYKFLRNYFWVWTKNEAKR